MSKSVIVPAVSWLPGSVVKENSAAAPGYLVARNPAEAKKRLEGDAAGSGAHAASCYSALARKY